jgi:hypothetical protein
MPDGTPPPFQFGGNNRQSGGSIARFRPYTHGPAHADRDQARLKPDHPALREARTLFPSSVHDPAGKSVLVSGHSNQKTGAMVMKGPWKGFPIYTITLEERATCPTSCHLWAECYGSAMPLAKRWQHGPTFIKSLDQDLRRKAVLHPGGFACRVHVLGDFYSVEYAWSWMAWIDALPQLHVWGYTAHAPDSEIGGILAMGNDRWPERWRMRFSGEPTAPLSTMQATTIWREPESKRVPEGIVCPAQTGGTDACATCGLCWALPAASERIVFIGHGWRTTKGKRWSKKPAIAAPQASQPQPAPAPDGQPIVPSEIRVSIGLDEPTQALLRQLIDAMKSHPAPAQERRVSSMADILRRMRSNSAATSIRGRPPTQTRHEARRQPGTATERTP